MLLVRRGRWTRRRRAPARRARPGPPSSGRRRGGPRCGRRRRPVGAERGSDALSAVEHRPADVVPQPLVVEYELANRLRELVALPPALESPCALAARQRVPPLIA